MLLLLILILLLAGCLPVYPYNKDWGYSPVGIIVLVLIILLIAGRI